MKKEKHYDWGLRALKSVLSGCKGILQRHIVSGAQVDLDSELTLIVKALLLDTASKLTYQDRIKFDALVGDVFRGITFGSTEHDKLIKALDESYLEFGLQRNERQVNNAILTIHII